MSEEINSIIEEINEEIKNDQLLTFLKKYKNAIFTTVAAVVVGILIYSSWYSRKTKQMEEITNVLLEELQSPMKKDSLVIEELLKDAPSELRPILSVMKFGKKLHDFKDMIENSEALLSLTKKHGVDIVWKDLATIICVSYRLKPTEELIKLLEPLTEKGRPFRFTAIEFIAMNYESLGDHEKARETLEKIVQSNEAPKTAKKRVSMLLSYLKNNPEKK
ncbi:MAG: hypothetical protein LBF54_02365 [Holosporaceae bacterium]|nr:hypothetical protein [Holosporaceae bacterium]